MEYLKTMSRKSGKDWAFWFYKELGYQIVDSEEDERQLKKTMDDFLEGFKKELRERLMDISCGTKPNRTECWAIKEILGDS